MHAFKAPETNTPKSRSKTVTTTLFDLLNEINTQFFGPQWEKVAYPDENPLEGQSFSLASLKVSRLFAAGMITFNRPHVVENHLLDYDPS